MKNKGVFEEQCQECQERHLYKAWVYVVRNLDLIPTVMGSFPSKQRNDVVRFVLETSVAMPCNLSPG